MWQGDGMGRDVNALGVLEMPGLRGRGFMRKGTKYFLINWIPIVGGVYWCWKVSRMLEEWEDATNKK